jgi:hypothetical protein
MNPFLVNPPAKNVQHLVARFTAVAYILVVLWSLFGPSYLASKETEQTAPFVSTLRKEISQLPSRATVLVQPPWRTDVVDAILASGIVPKTTHVTTALSIPHGKDAPPTLILKDPAVVLSDGLTSRLNEPLSRSEFGIEVGLLGAKKEGPTGGNLFDLLAAASVEVVAADGQRTSCTYRVADQRHVCPGLPDWVYVGKHTQTSGKETRQCIWTHPVSGGHVYVRWNNLTLPQTLNWSHAIANSGLQAKDGAPVTATIRVNKKSIGQETRDNRSGFAKKTLRLPKAQKNAALEIDLTTAKDGARHYCWYLDLSAGGGKK